MCCLGLGEECSAEEVCVETSDRDALSLGAAGSDLCLLEWCQAYSLRLLTFGRRNSYRPV